MSNPVLFEQYLNTLRFPINTEETFQLGNQTQYEDIAGLQPLPLQRMLQQIGRPFTRLYQELEKAKGDLYEGIIKKEIKAKLKPNPQRTQTVLNRAQAVENTRQTWDPIEAEWKERQNRLNTSPRSKPAQASFETFSNVVRGVSGNAFNQLLKSPDPYGILGDISDYLTPNQLSIIEQGVQEQLKQGVNPNKLIYEASGGNINTGRGNVRGAIKGAIDKAGGIPAGSMINYAEQKQNADPQEWLKRYTQQTDAPLIIPGVQHQFKGI